MGQAILDYNYYALENNKELKVSCFLDDDKEKQGRVLLGRKIYSPDYLNLLTSKEHISYLCWLYQILVENKKRDTQ